VLTLLGAMAVWFLVIGPGYDRAIASLAVVLLHGVESPRLTDIVRMDGVHAVVSHIGPASGLADQRLELTTHHNNAPLLIALVLATPGLPLARRDRALALGLLLLAATHVLQFMISVHWVYALENLGPYRVTDLRYLDRSFWQSLDNPAQIAKTLIALAESFYTRVGRLLAPIVVWMIVCGDAIRAQLAVRR
jgi:hypothetical protein